MRSLGTILVIDAPAQTHERIAALLDAMRQAQATHQPVEVTVTEPGHRLRVVPLCGLLLETADRARLPGITSALEDDLLQFMLPRLKPHDEHWSLRFVARMAVVHGTDRAQALFDDAVESLRAGANSEAGEAPR